MDKENRFMWHVDQEPDGMAGMDGSGNDPEFMFLGDAVMVDEVLIKEEVTEL